MTSIDTDQLVALLQARRDKYHDEAMRLMHTVYSSQQDIHSMEYRDLWGDFNMVKGKRDAIHELITDLHAGTIAQEAAALEECPECNGEGHLQNCDGCQNHAAFDCRDCQDAPPRCSLCKGTGKITREQRDEYDRVRGA